MDAQAFPHTDQVEHFERHVARTVLVLYYCGEPRGSLFDGQTRQIDSFGALGRFDYWVREPGMLALALLDACHRNVPLQPGERERIAAAVFRMMIDDAADKRRLAVPPLRGYALSGELTLALSYLAARGIISDRPSFTKGGSHQIVLEAPGIELAQRILDTAPSFGWYREQGETVRAFFPLLEHYDPGLTPALAASLIPTIQARYAQLFRS